MYFTITSFKALVICELDILDNTSSISSVLDSESFSSSGPPMAISARFASSESSSSDNSLISSHVAIRLFLALFLIVLFLHLPLELSSGQSTMKCPGL
ncbi:hypothetical protein QL285_026997 [Trifolium repens]|nr:hypothetical protein QL285_026997 [Trifolium repens]